MAYEPDPRLPADVTREASAPFSERPAADRGQFWNIDNHIRGRWAGLGAFWGLMVAAFDPFDWYVFLFSQGHAESLLVFAGLCIFGGIAVGFIAASIRRRFTHET